MYMTKLVVGIDLQNDFIDGVLGSPEAQAIVPKIVDYCKKIVYDDMYKSEMNKTEFVLTTDTHTESEIKYPVNNTIPEHCIEYTKGWNINSDITSAVDPNHTTTFKKSTYALEDCNNRYLNKSYDEIIIFGLCTDICVIANAIEFYKLYPMSKITIMSELCAGTTVENHNMALHLMKVMGFNVI